MLWEASPEEEAEVRSRFQEAQGKLILDLVQGEHPSSAPEAPSGPRASFLPHVFFKQGELWLDVSQRQMSDSMLLESLSDKLCKAVEDKAAASKSISPDAWYLNIDVSENRLTAVGISILLEFFARLNLRVRPGGRPFFARILRLYKNRLGDKGALEVARFITTQKAPVHELHLSHSGIGQDGAEAILRAFSVHPERSYPFRLLTNKGLFGACWVRLEHNDLHDPSGLLKAVSEAGARITPTTERRGGDFGPGRAPSWATTADAVPHAVLSWQYHQVSEVRPSQPPGSGADHDQEKQAQKTAQDTADAINSAYLKGLLRVPAPASDGDAKASRAFGYSSEGGAPHGRPQDSFPPRLAPGVGVLDGGPAANAAPRNVSALTTPYSRANARYADLVRGVYLRHNPGQVGEVEAMIEKYEGREAELYHKVCSKYHELAQDVETLESPAGRTPILQSPSGAASGGGHGANKMLRSGPQDHPEPALAAGQSQKGKIADRVKGALLRAAAAAQGESPEVSGAPMPGILPGRPAVPPLSRAPLLSTTPPPDQPRTPERRPQELWRAPEHPELRQATEVVVSLDNCGDPDVVERWRQHVERSAEPMKEAEKVMRMVWALGRQGFCSGVSSRQGPAAGPRGPTAEASSQRSSRTSPREPAGPQAVSPADIISQLQRLASQTPPAMAHRSPPAPLDGLGRPTSPAFLSPSGSMPGGILSTVPTGQAQTSPQAAHGRPPGPLTPGKVSPSGGQPNGVNQDAGDVDMMTILLKELGDPRVSSSQPKAPTSIPPPK